MGRFIAKTARTSDELINFLQDKTLETYPAEQFEDYRLPKKMRIITELVTHMQIWTPESYHYTILDRFQSMVTMSNRVKNE